MIFLHTNVFYQTSVQATNHLCFQCCQLSNFSDYPSNIFSQKHLATNLAIFKINLATFDVNQMIKGTHFPSKWHKKRKPKIHTAGVLSSLSSLAAIVQFNNNNYYNYYLIIVNLWYTLFVACTCDCWSVSTLRKISRKNY